MGSSGLSVRPYLLCFIVAPYISNGAPACEIDDEVSLLQVTSTGRAQESHNLERERGQETSFGRTRNTSQDAMDTLVELFDGKEYHCLHHYKAGTDFCKEASAFIANESERINLTLPHFYPDEGAMEFALDPELMKTPTPRCFASFYRNPFDLVVSSYLFDMAAPKIESYLTRPFGQALQLDSDGCTPGFLVGRMSNWCKDKPKNYASALFHRSISQIYLKSHSGKFSTLLPKADANESYPEYLQRVPLESGLLAASMFVNDSSLKPMQFSKDYLERSGELDGCSTEACFTELYDDCDGLWERIMSKWGIKEPIYTPMLNAARQACPGRSEWAKHHSSTDTATRSKLTYKPLHEMVAQLREIDRKHLGSQLAAVEKQLGCGSSGSYKSPML